MSARMTIALSNEQRRTLEAIRKREGLRSANAAMGWLVDNDRPMRIAMAVGGGGSGGADQGRGIAHTHIFVPAGGPDSGAPDYCRICGEVKVGDPS